MKRFLTLFTVISTLSLTGCVALDVGIIATHALDPTVNVVTTGDDIVARPEQKIYPVTLRDQTLFTTRCTYRGVIALYARDWDVFAEDGRVLFKADPDTIHGKALIAYEKNCEGETSPVLLVESKPLPIIDRDLAVKRGMGWRLRDYRGLEQRNDIPEWMPQVIKEVQAEASTNAAARNFLDHVTIIGGLPSVPAAPASGIDTK